MVVEIPQKPERKEATMIILHLRPKVLRIVMMNLRLFPLRKLHL